MAGWLSSKLKEAEQFLQQIDQQAAESLGNPEVPKPGDRQERHGKSKHIADLPYADKKGFLREASKRGKLDLVEAAPSALSKLVKKSDQGSRALNGNARSDDKDPSMYKKKQPASLLQIAGELKPNGNDDWMELLASPTVDLVASPALASSVGSSDSGRLGYGRGSSIKTTVNQSKKGVHRQQIDDLSFLAKRATRGSTVISKNSPPTISSKAGSVDPPMVVSYGEFEDKTLPRRLDSDLAQLDRLGAEANNEGLVSATFKTTGTNGDGVDLNEVITKGTTDCQSSVHAAVSVLTEKAKEEGGGDSELSDDQKKGPSRSWKQLAKSPSFASECKDTLAESNQSMAVPVNNEPDPFRSISQPFLSNPGGSFGDDIDRVHGIENQAKSTQELPQVNGENAVAGTHLFVHGRDLAKAHEIGNLELRPATQPVPASLQSDEGSYDSTSMSDADSNRESESADEEDVEMEIRKFAHKKRIARRKELTAARAAAAQAAIRERELFVEKLERELITLRRILAEREEQQGKEATELRMSVAEVMNALESEKKLHSSTRMKALAVEAQLENQNADLAKSLGALQWELDEQVSHILRARSMIDSKESVKAELERNLAKMRDDLCHQENGEPKLPERTKDEDCSFEDEHSDLWKKIQQCQIQVKDLEVKIHGLKDAQLVPTDIEQELENRLAQMTDYLIQKQAQVEALATEKATLLIRIEAVSNTIEEERAMASSQASRNKLGGRRSSDWDYDMEYGLGRAYDSKSKHSVYEPGESSTTMNGMGSVHLSPVLRQLNGFVSAGMFFLRKHRWAQSFVMIYMIILHLWVWFVVFMNSKHTGTLTLQEFALPKNISELKDGSNVTTIL